jgi:hypothetical protein
MTIGRMLGSTFAPTQKIRMMRERHDDAIRPPVTALVGFPLFLLFFTGNYQREPLVPRRNPRVRALRTAIKTAERLRFTTI